MSMEAQTAGRAPTLRDIARIAGVSVPTVSKVLNGRGDVSAETRERVQEATARVGYRRMPSAAVDALIAEQLVDLVLPAVGDSWASALIGGVERVAAQNSLDLVIIMVRAGESQGRSWVERLVDHRSRGALIAVVQTTASERRLLERARIPFVLIDPAGTPERACPECRSIELGRRGRCRELPSRSWPHLLRGGCRRPSFAELPRAGRRVLVPNPRTSARFEAHCAVRRMADGDDSSGGSGALGVTLPTHRRLRVQRQHGARCVRSRPCPRAAHTRTAERHRIR